MNFLFCFGLSLIGLPFVSPVEQRQPTNYSTPRSIIHCSISAADSLVDPVIKIGAHLDTLLTVQQILKSPFLQVHTPGSTRKHTFSINYFKLVIEYGSGDFHESEVGGSNWLSPAQLALIKNLQPGDQLFFETIKGTDGIKKAGVYPSLLVHIK